MGTRFELALVAGDGTSATAVRAAGEAALDEIELWHRRLNRFAGDSLVAHLGRTASIESIRLDREVCDLLTDALAVWRASGGAFDVTMTPAETGAAAGEEPVERAAGIVLDPAAQTVRFARGPVALDFGGIAKGHALDCAAVILHDAGVRHALLHGGTSSVLAIGHPPGAAAWNVALGRTAGNDVLALSDQALSLSDAASQIEITGARHIIDRRSTTGRASFARVAVTGPSARLADAWSTALAVLGDVPDGFPAGYAATFLRSAS